MKYFLVAGEASGDMHGAALMSELKQLDAAAEFCFLGGDAMQAVGGELVRHYRDMAFMGFVNVVLNAGKVVRNFRLAKQAVRAFQPDVVILIDYPGFNLKLSTFVVNELKLPVYYYIAPKVWAWKAYRIRQLKREMSGMLTIFPFETAYFAGHGLKVQYVGNPSVDAIHAFLEKEPAPEEISPQRSARIALLPGSRRQEIKACLPVMLQAVEGFPEYEVIISGAPGVEPEFYASFLTNYPSVRVVTGQTYALVRSASAAIVNSGTATLETALLDTPQLVVYHVYGGRLTYWLKDRIIKTRYISLVNILMNKEVVKELVAHLMTAENIAAELERILNHQERRQQMLDQYRQLQLQLGPPGTAARAATYLVDALKNGPGR